MLSTGFKISKYEFVTIVVNAGDTRSEFYFPDLPNLRNGQIQTISIYPGGTIATDPNAIPVLSVVDARQSFLVLNINDKEDIKIPLISLVSIRYEVSAPSNLASQNGYLPFAGQVVRWPKSYVKFPNGHSVGQFSICMGVFYK
jgi:hypothetical protein